MVWTGAGFAHIRTSSSLRSVFFKNCILCKNNTHITKILWLNFREDPTINKLRASISREAKNGEFFYFTLKVGEGSQSKRNLSELQELTADSPVLEA